MASKLTNYQLKLVVNKIAEEVNKVIESKYDEKVELFSFESNPECVEDLELYIKYVYIFEELEKLNTQMNEIFRKLRERNITYSIYTPPKIEDVKKTIINKHITKPIINTRDIELAVLLNQNGDMSNIIETIVNSYLEKINQLI